MKASHSAAAGVEILPEPATQIAAYAGIAAAFDVDTVLDVAGSPGRFTLTERQLPKPYLKDYDALPPGKPSDWPTRFQLDDWGLFSARLDGTWVGAAAIATDPTLAPHSGPRDAVLWDLRVAPGHRGRGIGRRLFEAAEAWARSRRNDAVVVETQNVNVAACRLYERSGCVLEHVNATAYPDFPDEVQLVWRKPLA